jgi:uncharacterized DUF497 family protein
VEFEWDEPKNRANIEKHGIAFHDTLGVFADPDRLVLPDERFGYGEQRFVVIGSIESRIYVVVYTMRGGVIRIISARKANMRERLKYGYDES